MTLPTDGATPPTETTHCRACGGTGEFDSGEESYTCGVCGGVGEHPTDLEYGVTGTAEHPPVHYPERPPSLAEFLLARIAEDEAAAIAAGSGPWHWEQGYGEMCNDAECPFGSLTQVKQDGELYQLMEVHGYDVDQEWQGATHIARHDPARVLAECDAKRRIVRWVNQWPLRPHKPSSVDGVLEMLALPYADHDDFRPEWTP